MIALFASKLQASNLLGKVDIFTSSLNEFELMAKLQTTEKATVSDYLYHAKNQSLEWNDKLKERVSVALDGLSFPLSINPMPLPEEVVFVLTTGLEEGFAAYTRGNAIFLNERIIRKHSNLSWLIAHELVHVATRNNSGWKDKLYSTIGFKPCNTPSFSNQFQKYLFSNPDSPQINHALEITYNGIKQKIAPIIFTNQTEYVGGLFFEYIEVGLFLLDGTNETDYELFPEEKRIISFDECDEFFQNVGNNTSYLFHAEEILADNIADIYINRIDSPSPHVSRKILSILNPESF